MSKKTEAAIANALKAIHEDVVQLQKNDQKRGKVVDSHSVAIAALQQDVMEMRNKAIAAEANSRVPYKDISARYGVSEGRISQIKKQYQ